MDALLDDPLGRDRATTPWGFAETYSVLRRRYNEGSIDLPTFLTMTASLQTEVVDSGDFGFLPIHDAAIFASTLMIRQHSLNATDAAILTMLTEFVPSLASGHALVLIAADQRLLRAAATEGLTTLNPELFAVADVPAFLASL